METQLQLEMLPQPDDSACGPTCLHAVYRYYGDLMPLERVVAESHRLEEGGTLAVLLGSHALSRGYEATLYTYNLRVFDPTWFGPDAPDLLERLEARRRSTKKPKLQLAIEAYTDFLHLGGRIRWEDLTPALIRKFLNRSIPILTGLSATYLYRCTREFGPDGIEDDVRGDPVGHFVVLCGYDRRSRTVLVADPLTPNPVSTEPSYAVNVDRVIGAILLGVLTYDANLLIIRPRDPR